MIANPQKAHYESLHDAYERHYYDDSSLEYRRRFLLEPLIRGLDLNGKRIADIACGSGWNTRLLQEQVNASFHGFDISQRACDDYRRNTGQAATCIDLTVRTVIEEPFDAAIVVGGLHHMVRDLQTVAENLTRLLRPGGYLLAVEPNRDFFLNRVRDAWYRRDPLFEEQTERSLSLNELCQHFDNRLEILDATYLGGPAYFVILNSLVLRLPLAAKRPLAALLLPLDSLYGRLPGRSAHPAFVSRWRRSI